MNSEIWFKGFKFVRTQIYYKYVGQYIKPNITGSGIQMYQQQTDGSWRAVSAVRADLMGKTVNGVDFLDGDILLIFNGPAMNYNGVLAIKLKDLLNSGGGIAIAL